MIDARATLSSWLTAELSTRWANGQRSEGRVRLRPQQGVGDTVEEAGLPMGGTSTTWRGAPVQGTDKIA